MTPIKIALTIGDEDLKHFRGQMRQARTAAREAGSEAVIAAADELLEKVRLVDPPEFVRDRLGKLATLIAMVKDERWAIPRDVRTRVLDALAYFVQPQDMIPDDVPVLGFLDDAIMIELIVRELRHDIEAYEDFVGRGVIPRTKPLVGVGKLPEDHARSGGNGATVGGDSAERSAASPAPPSPQAEA